MDVKNEYNNAQQNRLSKNNTQKNNIPSHMICLDGKNKLSITGVKEIYNYSENMLELETTRGNLLIKGTNIHLDQMSIESSNLSATGEIYLVQYKKGMGKNKFIKWLTK